MKRKNAHSLNHGKSYTKMLLAMAILISLFSNVYAARGTTCSSRCGSFEVGADWLYWKVFQDNMDFASEITALPSSTVDVNINSKPSGPDFHANSGFRVFASYFFGNDLWQISAAFTRFLSTAGLDLSASSPNFIVLNTTAFPLFTIFNNTTFSSLTSSWDFQINYFDLDVSRGLRLSPRFLITPHMGLRGMWVREKLHIDAIPNGSIALFSELNEKYNGCGIESGLYVDLQLGSGFSLKGHFGGSLLYANIKLSEGFTDVGLVAVHADKSDFRLNPTIDGFIGLQYCYTCFHHPITLHLGWEQHLIMNINNLPLSYSDLTLQGLTLGGSIVF